MTDKETLLLLEQLLKMAATGEHYSKDEYNRERYASLKEIGEKLLGEIPGFSRMLIAPYDKSGYITPKVGVNAIIQNEKGEFLLEKRMDDKCWGIPGGWCEVGFTAEENVVREIKEEAGLEAEVVKLLHVVSRTPSEKQLFTSYHILFSCRILGGELKRSHESADVKWIRFEDVERWHFDHKSWVETSLRIINPGK